MEDINNYYHPVEVVEMAFEVRMNPAEFGDWLRERTRYDGWDSPRSIVEGYTAWWSYQPSRLERLEHEGPEIVIGLPFRVSGYLLNEQGHFDSDYRDYTPIQFWLVQRGEWTEVTAVCKPPGAWPDTAVRLRGLFDWLIEEVRSEFGDDFKGEAGEGATAVPGASVATGVGKMQINIEGMEGQTPYFVHWVGEHTAGGSDPLPWGTERVIVGSLPVPWETLADYPALELPYRMITPEGDNFYPEGWAIQLLVTKKQAGSFNVRLTCAVDAALPYFWRLVAKIRKRWPLAIVDGLPDADDGAGLPGKGATAVTNQPGAADVGGDGSDGEGETAVEFVVKLRIPARVPDFVAWIGEQQSSEWIPYGEARLIVERLPVPWPTYDSLPFLALPETIITPEGDVMHSNVAAITFSVLRVISGDSLLVEARCVNRLAKPHFDYLIKRLFLAVPGTKNDSVVYKSPEEFIRWLNESAEEQSDEEE